MQHPEDFVSATIMESAKTRFDYHAFKGVFRDTGSAHLPENVLRMTIEGYALEHSPEKIVADINCQLALLGIGFAKADLRRFVEEKQAELKSEVLATLVAAALFEQGAEPTVVLAQVRSVLERTTEAV